MGKKIDKFLLLIWKNFLLQWRHPKQTIIEIFSPVVFCSILTFIRSLVVPVPESPVFFEPFEIGSSSFWYPSQIYYSPYSPPLEKIISDTVRAISSEQLHELRYISFENSKEMEKNLTSADDTFLACVMFEDFLAKKNNLPPHLKVTLRFPGEMKWIDWRHEGELPTWMTNLLFPVYQAAGVRLKKRNDGAYPRYNNEGFLKLQLELSYAIIDHYKQTVHKTSFSRTSTSIFMQRFPYPMWMWDNLIWVLRRFVGLIVMLSFVYSCIGTVKIITTEKEKQLKETMKIMGLPNWLHWTAWFIKTFLVLSVATILIVILLKANWYPGSDVSVFTHSNPLVIFIFLILFVCATITFCFATSVFFSKASTAATFAGMAWFLSYIPYSFIQEHYADTSLAEKLLASLLSNSAMAFGFQLIIMFEGIGEAVGDAAMCKVLIDVTLQTTISNAFIDYCHCHITGNNANNQCKRFCWLFRFCTAGPCTGKQFPSIIVSSSPWCIISLQWHNMWKNISPDNTLKMGYLMIMLILDTFIYLLIALYVEAVFPGDYGVPRPWNFIFYKSFWCEQSHQPIEHPQEQPIGNEFFEDDPKFLEPTIQIRHLGKIYSDEKVAVRDLSLNMYPGQITVLLGHNGAGKTSTMFMLTGMIPPTSGTAIINGLDIRTEMTKVRESLGLCPQHNILFDELTVKEHLYFFARLKGFSKEKAKEESSRYIEILDLVLKTDAQSKTLSGGMKRKLSAGMALCAGSSIVLFDEPTAGVDPAARRSLWNLMQSQKEDRTIILTTHFMDEADLLGDRIAIMAGGKLQCCGSSFFLKKKFGTGYLLIMDKSPKCDTQQVTKLLQNYIPNIEVKSDIGSELIYVMGEKQAGVFKNMLKDLETNSAKLGVLSYGISLTTLEEVFMRVGADDGQQEENKNATKTAVLAQDSNAYELHNRDTGKSLLTGWRLWRNQFWSMMLKRRLSIFRSWILLVIHHCLPMCIVALSIVVAQDKSPYLPNLEIKLDAYNDPVTVMAYDGYNKYMEKYMEILKDNNNRLINWGAADLSEKMFEETENNLFDVRVRYICGATFLNNNSIVAWFNNEAYHSPPLCLQMVLNAILEEEVSSDYSIHLHNYPLPYKTKKKFTPTIKEVMGFQVAFNIGFSMVLVSSFYILFYVNERAVKAKHLQFSSGVDVIAFWAPPFLCDLVIYLSISLCIIITLAVFQVDGFKTSEELGRIYSILLSFGFCMLPMTYLASYLFDLPSTGYIRMALFNIFTGVFGFLLVEILTMPEIDRKHLADSLHWAFLVFPIYSLSAAIKDMNILRATHELCDVIFKKCLEMNETEENCRKEICSNDLQCCTITKNYYDWEAPGIGRNFIFTLSMGIIFVIILLIIEYRISDKLQQKLLKYCFKRYSHPPPPITIEHEDSDVNGEKEKIRKATQPEINNYILVMRDITKYYGNFLAVNSLCLGLNRYECFGLLGANGAGKTSTFKIMTGDIKCSSGEAWVNGLSLKTDMKKIYHLIGYCPQFDALLDDLTCRETLMIYCLLRGITYSDSKSVSIQLAHDFDFYKHIDKTVKKLSGGNKRKLSTAIALIGDPLILYLDEPTTGMDPRTKRNIWNELCKVRDSGKCIILTSHSMEECEALCTRLAVMVNGSFRCLGSNQHLKSKFSEGYTLIIKIRKARQSMAILSSEVELIEEFVKQNFRKTIVREKYHELITFYIADKTIPWSTMFGIMEQGKRSLNIEDYSLGQSGLEQVFLSFTKYQREE